MTPVYRRVSFFKGDLGMDIRRVFQVLQEVLEDIDSNQIENNFSKVVQMLDTWSKQANEANAIEYSRAIERYRVSFGNSRIGVLQPLSALILRLMGGGNFDQDFSPDHIASLVTGSTTPADAIPRVKEVHAKFTDLISRWRQLVESMRSLGLEKRELDEGRAEFAAIIPSEVVSLDVKDSQREIRNWNIAVGNMADAFGDSRDSVHLLELERGSLVLVVGVGAYVAKKIFEVVNELLDSYIKIQEIRVLHATLAEKRVAKKTLDSLDADIKKMVKEEIDSVVNNSMQKEEHHILKDARTDGEQQVLIRFAAEFFLKRIDDGSQIEISFRISGDEDEAGDANEEGDIEHQPEAPEQARMQGFAGKWVDVKSLPKHVLGLPEPKLKENPPEEY